MNKHSITRVGEKLRKKTPTSHWRRVNTAPFGFYDKLKAEKIIEDYELWWNQHKFGANRLSVDGYCFRHGSHGWSLLAKKTSQNRALISLLHNRPWIQYNTSYSPRNVILGWDLCLN